METVTDFIFLGSKITADGDCSHEIKRHLLLGRKDMTNLDSMLKSRDITIADKATYNQSYDFSSFHIWMWELAECRTIDAFELWCWRRLLKSALDSKIKLVNPKRNQLWIFIGRTDAEAETPVLCPPYAKSWLIGKDSDAGKDWGQEEKETTEDEMAGWHHRLHGHEFG